MYNEHFNEIWLNRVRRVVEGKRVLFVGNSPTIFSHERGDLINSYDFVVRFGKGAPVNATKKYLGTKCNLWFTGCLRLGMYKLYPKHAFKVLCYAQKMAYYEKEKFLLVNKELFNDHDFQIYRDYFLTGSLDHMHGMIQDVYGDLEVDSEARISQGAFCLSWFLNDIKTQKSIDLIGFDFNTAKIAYKMPDGGEKVAYSWHIPMNNKDGLHVNVHASGIEADYVEKQVDKGLVNWHKDDVTDLNMEALNKIANIYRPQKAGKLYKI